MSELISTFSRGIKVMKYLASEDCRPKTVDEIREALALSGNTIRRSLKTLEADEFALYDPAAKAWGLDKGLIKIAWAYKRGILAHVHEIETKFKTETGEDIHDE